MRLAREQGRGSRLPKATSRLERPWVHANALEPGGIRFQSGLDGMVLSTPETPAHPTPPLPAPGLKQVLEKVPGSLTGRTGLLDAQPHCDHGWKEKKDMGVTRPQVPLRQPFPVSSPSWGPRLDQRRKAEPGAQGAGSAVLGRESQVTLPGPRHRPQTEAKPWKRDHVTRAPCSDKRSLNKLENKCLTLPRANIVPEPIETGHIRAGGSQAAGVGSRTAR